MTVQAPHQRLQPARSNEKFLVALFDRLWEVYRAKMSYVRIYEKVIADHGASFTNDHIAFRTLATQNPASGYFVLSRVFEALGYVPRACYEFPDKHFSSIHYAYPKEGFPKLFITQLETWELSAPVRALLLKTAKGGRAPLADADVASLRALTDRDADWTAALFQRVANVFLKLPWPLPRRRDVESVNAESQFGAWVMVHGHGVNHFTASVDSHRVEALNDIEKVVAALRSAGIPMKKEIEGARGSKLRQSATEAVVLPTLMKEGRKTVRVPWPFAYMEIAERPLIVNPSTGRPERFEGFLGPQATQLFEMTKPPSQ